jgi:plastocyanin domain-containing protein
MKQAKVTQLVSGITGEPSVRLELYDEKSDEWDMICEATVRSSREYPGNKDHIHIDFLLEVLKASDRGYTVRYSTENKK